MINRVNCPNCGKRIPWTTDNRYRPFCSKRCQLIDFGEWAEGNRYIASDADHDDASASDLDKD